MTHAKEVLFTISQKDSYIDLIVSSTAGVLPLTALEEEDVDEVTMVGWLKIGHFWPVTVLAQFLTGPYVSNWWQRCGPIQDKNTVCSSSSSSSSPNVIREASEYMSDKKPHGKKRES